MESRVTAALFLREVSPAAAVLARADIGRERSSRTKFEICPEGGGHLYPVSNAFLDAVKVNTRKYYWIGRITTTAGTVYEFDQDDMVKGSGYITSQCCGSTEIELGTVYAAEMGISLFSEINRYTLEDAKVELFYHLQIAGGSYETIPMGIFEVSESILN